MPTVPLSPARPSGDGRRETNAASVLRAVLDHGPVARSRIARLSGLSPAAVSRQCTELAGLRLVREVPELVADGAVGRPQIPVDLRSGKAGGPLAAGVHIGVPQSTFCLVDLRGTVLAQQAFPHGGGIEPDTLADAVGETLAAFLAARTPSGSRLLGVGAAVGGRVDPATATVVRHGALGRHRHPLGAVLERHTRLPVRIDNHARAVARSELLYGRPAARRSLVHLFVGNVVDAAVAVAGVVHQGPRSGAGDVAHLPVPGSTAECPCGRTGCLTVCASGTAHPARDRTGPPRGGRRLRHAAGRGGRG